MEAPRAWFENITDQARRTRRPSREESPKIPGFSWAEREA